MRNDHGFNKQPSKYGGYDNERLDKLKDEAVKQVDLAYQCGMNDAAEQHDRLSAAKDAVCKAAEAITYPNPVLSDLDDAVAKYREVTKDEKVT